MTLFTTFVKISREQLMDGKQQQEIEKKQMANNFPKKVNK